MMTGTSFRIFLIAGTSCFALVSPAAMAQVGGVPAAGAPVAQATVDTSDIIVTAQRRAERAQDVPIAITAFSPERLQQQNITQAQDLQASVPSLVVGANGQGSRDSQTPTLRGQGATFQASPGVVLYLNEVPLPSPITLSQQGGPGNFVDLENLQVLAGPQGTLFGRNTTGGAVLLVPHKPTNDFSGSIQGKYGNYDDKELEGVLNIPVVDDKLLVRVVGAYQDRDGFTRDVAWNKDRDDKHWYSGRIGITFRPTDRIENYLMAYGAYSRFNGTGIINQGFNIDGTAGLAQLGLCSNTPIGISGNFSCDVYRAATAQANALGPRKTAHSVDDFQKTKTWATNSPCATSSATRSSRASTAMTATAPSCSNMTSIPTSCPHPARSRCPARDRRWCTTMPRRSPRRATATSSSPRSSRSRAPSSTSTSSSPPAASTTPRSPMPCRAAARSTIAWPA
jgi:iron complex outermembrane receptor protein